MITQTFDLNLIPEQAPVVVHCDQYDKGTGRLIIKLYEGDVAYSPTGTAIIQGCKPDGHGFSYAATLSGNTVTADLTEQMSCVSGRVRCQIVVTESTGRTGTFAFILEVQPSALPSDADMSESEYEFIEQAIELTQQAAEDAQESAEDAEAWAVGERGGVPVGPTDPTYHNNAEYYAQQASQIGSLDDLNDVTITTPTNDQVLTYDSNAGKWVNANAQSSVSDLDDLNDVTITTPVDQQVLTYDSNSGEWINANAQGGVTQLDQLSDVTISAPTDGQSLIYDSNAGEWVNGSGGGGSSTLAGLTDVTITSATDGQALLYDANSGDWVNGTVSGGGGMNTDGSNADSAVAFPSDSISSGKYAKSTGGFAFCDEMATTDELTNNLATIPANTTTETRILNYSLSSYPVQFYWLQSSDKVTATAAMTSDITKSFANSTIRVHKENNYIEVWATNTTATSSYIHYARQEYTKADHDSIAIGKSNNASGKDSVALGMRNTANADYSFAEGFATRAVAQYAHSEGFSTTASGVGAHAEGSNCVASGNYSHAEGDFTLASSQYQFVVGKNNVEDNQDTYAVIVGNGANSSNRANAASLDWSGNLEVAGDVTAGNGLSVENIGEGLASILATGATNATGSTISAGTYFYLDGVLVRALADIANGATFTLNTNYEVVTAGALNETNKVYSSTEKRVGTWIDGKPIYEKTYTIPGNSTSRVWTLLDSSITNTYKQVGSEWSRTGYFNQNTDYCFLILSLEASGLKFYVSSPYTVSETTYLTYRYTK